MAGETWAWRESSVLEAIPRLTRHEQVAPREVIAAEAILHLDDVNDAITHLVDGGYLDTLAVISDDPGQRRSSRPLRTSRPCCDPPHTRRRARRPHVRIGKPRHRLAAGGVRYIAAGSAKKTAAKR